MAKDSTKLKKARAGACALDLSVMDVMSHHPISLQASDTLFDLATVIHQKHIRHVPVVDTEGNLLGLVSHRDLLSYSISEQAKISPEEKNNVLKKIQLGSLIHDEQHEGVITVRSGENLRTAAIELIDRRIGGMCVTQENSKKLVGILTEGDFVKVFTFGNPPGPGEALERRSSAFEKAAIYLKNEKLTVKDMMSTDVVTASPKDRLAEVADVMQRKRIHHLPVVDGLGRLLGLVTHRDLLRYSVSDLFNLTEEDKQTLRSGIFVDQMMQREVKTVEPTQDLMDAAWLMENDKYGCLPVVSKKRLVGILAEGDFVRFFADGF